MQKKLVTAAIASAFALGGTTAHAVDFADVGNVLISPFYGAAAYDDGSANETYFSIVNTQNVTKAVKVRFREGRGSEDSLDFHVYLSPYDIWTGAITQNSSGQTVVVSGDSSCTVPAMTPDPEASNALFLPTYIPDEYEGDVRDDLPTSQERVSEGYFEIIEMATFSQEDGKGEYNEGQFAWHVEHVDGEPRNCSAAVSLNEILWIAGEGDPSGTIFEDDVDVEFGSPTGGMFGNAALINVVRGTYKPFEMIALDSLELQEFDGANNLFFSQNSNSDADLLGYTADNGLKAAKNNQIQFWDLPDLSTMSSAFDSDADTSAGLESINSLLLTTQIINEYVIDEDINAGTDWVVTFPTKKFYVTDGDLAPNADGEMVHFGNGSAVDPFTVAFNENLGQACEPVNFRIFDREEGEEVPEQPSGVGFSPGLPTAPDVTSLCFEMNVISINDADTAEDLQQPSSVLGGTTTRQNIQIEELDGDAGWMILQLTENAEEGLPAIGFMAADFINEGIVDGGALRNYGGTWNHRYQRTNDNGNRLEFTSD